jgi:hypothetical protein
LARRHARALPPECAFLTARASAMASQSPRFRRRNNNNSARSGAALLALLSLLVLAAPRVLHAAVQRDVRVPGSGRATQLFACSSDAFSSPRNATPALLLLRGFSCPLTPETLAAAPPSVLQALSARFFTGDITAGGNALGLPDDIGDLARAAADELGVVAIVLSAPRRTRACAPCAPAVAAASAATPGDPERDITLAGAALLVNGTASGADCPGWDASPACCQSSPSAAGDVPFILGAIDAVAAAAPAINKRAVYAMGFSGGAFMALRLACDAPPGALAGVAAYAGGAPPSCAPRALLNALVLAGKRDLEVPFGGASNSPGGEATLSTLARADGCTGAPARTRKRGFGSSGNDADVDVISYSGCSKGVRVEGWFVAQWGHLPPRQQGAAFFLSAVRRLIGRG